MGGSDESRLYDGYVVINDDVLTAARARNVMKVYPRLKAQIEKQAKRNGRRPAG